MYLAVCISSGQFHQFDRVNFFFWWKFLVVTNVSTTPNYLVCARLYVLSTSKWLAGVIFKASWWRWVAWDAGVTKVLISNAGAGVDDLSRQPIAEGVFPQLEGLQLINPPNRM